MNKQDIIKLVVVLVVIGFVAEQYYFSSQGAGFNIFNLGGSNTGSASNGTTTFKGTVRNYDNILVLDINTSQETVEQIRNLEHVRSITQQPGYWLVTMQSREDVPALAKFLNNKNVNSLARVNINIPETILVDTANGVINVSTYSQNQVIKLVTTPVVESGDEVSISMRATVQNKVLVSYDSAQIALQNVELLVDVSIVKLNQIVYELNVPWEERNSLNTSNSSRMINTIVFGSPLTNQQMMEKRQLSYITYISSESAEVEANFTDKNRVISDFNGTAITFVPSRSIITSDHPLNITSNSTVKYNYNILFPDQVGRYRSENVSFDMDFSEPKQVNSTVQLNISALVIGQKLYSVKIN
ncbi:MAG: hypothetical protein ACP5N9_05815 [Candidatus Bilamarchaeum sp.]|jgi:hypothetical protein